jgi:CBS domain-containing protein
MSIGEICNREVIIVHRNETVQEAAKLMRQHHVGDVVVIDDHNGVRVPVGIVTDRDVVVEVVATGLDEATMTVGDIMSQDLFTVKESAGVFEAIQYMRRKTVRRLPIINDDGGLVGILTLDDVLELLSEELLDLSKLVRYEQKKEALHRP